MAGPNGLLVLQTRDLYSFPHIGGGIARGFAGYDASGAYTFRVPAGVHRIVVELIGPPQTTTIPGTRCISVYDVTPGQVFTVTLGATTTTFDGTAIATMTAGQGPLFSPGTGDASFGAGTAASGGNLLNSGTGRGHCLIWW